MGTHTDVYSFNSTKGPKNGLKNNVSISDYPNEQLVEISWKEIDNSNLQRR